MYDDPRVSEKHMEFLDTLEKYYKKYDYEEWIIEYCYEILYEIYSSYNNSFEIEIALVQEVDNIIECIIWYIEVNDNGFKEEALFNINKIDEIITWYGDQNLFKQRLKTLFPVWIKILES